jgi:hypothetical protein
MSMHAGHSLVMPSRGGSGILGARAQTVTVTMAGSGHGTAAFRLRHYGRAPVSPPIAVTRRGTPIVHVRREEEAIRAHGCAAAGALPITISRSGLRRAP